MVKRTNRKAAEMNASVSVIEAVRAANAIEENNVVLNQAAAPVITLDDDVLIGDAAIKRERASKYPWDALAAPVIENGKVVKQGSFFVEGAKLATFTTLCSTRSKKGEAKFKARKWTGPNGVLGVRVFRVA